MLYLTVLCPEMKYWNWETVFWNHDLQLQRSNITCNKEMNHHHMQLPIYLNCFHYNTVLVWSIEETVTTHNYACVVFCSIIKRPTTLQLTEQDHFNLVKLVAWDAFNKLSYCDIFTLQWLFSNDALLQVHFAGTCGCVSKDTIFIIAWHGFEFFQEVPL